MAGCLDVDRLGQWTGFGELNGTIAGFQYECGGLEINRSIGLRACSLTRHAEEMSRAANWKKATKGHTNLFVEGLAHVG